MQIAPFTPWLLLFRVSTPKEAPSVASLCVGALTAMAPGVAMEDSMALVRDVMAAWEATEHTGLAGALEGRAATSADPGVVLVDFKGDLRHFLQLERPACFDGLDALLRLRERLCQALRDQGRVGESMVAPQDLPLQGGGVQHEALVQAWNRGHWAEPWARVQAQCLAQHLDSFEGAPLLHRPRL